jgi:hypothetical protein
VKGLVYGLAEGAGLTLAIRGSRPSGGCAVQIGSPAD